MTTPSSDPQDPSQVRLKSVSKSVSDPDRADASQVRPVVPSSSMGTDLASPQPSPSLDPQTDETDRAFITDRTRPFWQAVLTTMSAAVWYDQEQLIWIGTNKGLAERTVRNLMPRAARRGLLVRSEGTVYIRHEALRALLDEPAGSDRSASASRVSDPNNLPVGAVIEVRHVDGQWALMFHQPDGRWSCALGPDAHTHRIAPEGVWRASSADAELEQLRRQVVELQADNDRMFATLTNRERDHADRLAEQATVGDTGLCRTCVQPIWFEEGEIGHRKRVGWSDRITRGGDSIVCFSAVHYRHAPIIGRERALWDKALELVEAVLAEPHDRQWWPVEPYADPPNDDEVVEVAVVDVDRAREALAAKGLTREVRHGA